MPRTNDHDLCSDIKPDNILLTFEPKVMDMLVSTHLAHRPVRKHPLKKVLDISEETIISESLPIPAITEVNPIDWNVKLADFGCGMSVAYSLLIMP